MTPRFPCLRLISTTTLFSLAVQIPYSHRLTIASILSYLGRVPSETSSIASPSQRVITNTSNSHSHHLLI